MATAWHEDMVRRNGGWPGAISDDVALGARDGAGEPQWERLRPGWTMCRNLEIRRSYGMGGTGNRVNMAWPEQQGERVEWGGIAGGYEGVPRHQ